MGQAADKNNLYFYFLRFLYCKLILSPLNKVIINEDITKGEDAGQQFFS
jgi:hypothetical protein